MQPHAQAYAQPEPHKEEAPAPRAVDWENPRVAAILSAAAKCFARKGFSATTLAEIGKELGLRKSIVHYYFASKAALIHEVQSYTYHRYLEHARQAIQAATTDPASRARSALAALWNTMQADRTAVGLNIEVWSAARRDPEVQRRAVALQRDARSLVMESLGDHPNREALSTLVLAVLDGLSVAESLEGEQAKTREAFESFIQMLGAG